MTARLRTIEVHEDTADTLEARAAARGVSVAEVVAELADLAEPGLPMANIAAMEAFGQGPWAPGVLAEDAQRFAEFERSGEGIPWEEVDAWMRSWGTPNELPLPKLRKL